MLDVRSPSVFEHIFSQSLLQEVMDRGSGNFHYWSLFIVYFNYVCQSNQSYNNNSIHDQ